ncbi:MAG: hypothetical protein ABJG88_00835 [Litorimonas sp.]
MSIMPELKKDLIEILNKLSLRTVISLLTAALSGALIWILIDLNREEMAETGQWLPPENGIGLLALWFITYMLFIFLPLIILYRKTGNGGIDERDADLYRQTGANGFCILQVLTFLALFWYMRHDDGLLLFNSILVALLVSVAVSSFILYVRYRAISAPLLSTDDE